MAFLSFVDDARMVPGTGAGLCASTARNTALFLKYARFTQSLS